MSQNVFIFVLIIVETIEVTLLFDNRNILAYTNIYKNEGRDCMQTQVKEWRNSQEIRLPKEALKSVGIGINETLDVMVSNGVIILIKMF